MGLDITEGEARDRLQKLSTQRKEAKLTGPKLLEGAYRRSCGVGPSLP
jgi:hypothetical protein